MQWIKFRSELRTHPAIRRIARQLGTTRAHVIGALAVLLMDADEHTEDGFLPGLEGADLDDIAELDGFAEALVAWGWLEITDDGVRWLNWESHNGETAKARADGQRRKQRERAGLTQPRRSRRKSADENPISEPESVSQDSVTTCAHPVTTFCDKSVTREDKIREELPPPAGARANEPTEIGEIHAQLARWSGRSASQIPTHAAARIAAEYAEEPVAVDGAVMPPGEFVRLAVDDAIRQAVPFTSHGPAARWIASVRLRCREEGCRPGEWLERQHGASTGLRRAVNPFAEAS